MFKYLVTFSFLLFAAILAGFFLNQHREQARHENLKQPRIVQLADQTMLVVQFRGNPEKGLDRAISTLYQAILSYNPMVKNMKISSPRMRWEEIFPDNQKPWQGRLGLAMPKTATALPASVSKQFPALALETWAYGDVAEILYEGPWNQIQASLAALQTFMNQQGYLSQGLYEVEYLKRPGMLSFGRSKKYRVILRYRIQKP